MNKRSAYIHGYLTKTANDFNKALTGVQKAMPDYFKKSPNALDLLKYTGMHETHGGKLRNPNPNYYGGHWQIDKGTFKDLQSAGPGKYPKLSKAIDKLKTKGHDVRSWKWKDLDEAPTKSAIMAALKYRTVPEKIPSTLNKMALYWKKHYNTSKGKGDYGKFIKTVVRQLKKQKAKTTR